MGLDCYVPDGGGGRIGSYSGFNFLRELLKKSLRLHLEKRLNQNSMELLALVFESLFENYPPEELPTLVVNKILSYTFNNVEELQNQLTCMMDEDTSLIFEHPGEFEVLKSLEILPEISYNQIDNYNFTCFSGIHEAGLTGLYKLWYHSDCEGSFSTGDCVDIVQTFELCLPYIEEEYRDWIEQVRDYFQSAVDVQSYLVFC